MRSKARAARRALVWLTDLGYPARRAMLDPYGIEPLPVRDCLLRHAQRSREFRALWDAHEPVATPEGTKVVVLLHVDPDGRTSRVTCYTPRPRASTTRALVAYAASAVT